MGIASEMSFTLIRQYLSEVLYANFAQHYIECIRHVYIMHSGAMCSRVPADTLEV